MAEMVEADLFCGWQPATTLASTARKQNTRVIVRKPKRFSPTRKIAARDPDFTGRWTGELGLHNLWQECKP
jgi:hypothetical protein